MSILFALGVDRVPPVVAVTSPASGSNQAGTMTLSATVTDNDQVVGVQFKVDGVNVGAEQTVGPFTTTYDTHLLTAGGGHAVQVVARDRVGNLTTVSVGFNVTNAVPGSTYLDFGAYQQFDSDAGAYTTGRWLVKDRGHHTSVDWRWANGNDKALPSAFDTTHYQMRIISLEATSRTESDGSFPHVVGVWINGSEVVDVGNWYAPATIGSIRNVAAGDVVRLEKWVIDGGNDAYTAFFAEAGMRVWYDFQIKSGFLS